MRVHEDGLLLQPADLPPGKVMQFWAAPPADVGRDEGLAALARIQDPMRGLGAAGPSTCRAPQLLTAGVVVQDCIVRVNGAAVETQVYMRPPRNGQAEWMRIAFSQEEALLHKYGGGLKAISSNTNELWSTLKSMAGDDRRRREAADRASAQERRAAADRAIRVAPGKGVADKDIAVMLWTWYQPSGESMVEHLHLLLKDGTGYSNLDFPPDELDMAAARRMKPERVMQWRREGDRWLVKDHDDKDWRQIQGRPANPGSPGQRIEGTFTHSWYSILGGGSSQNRFHFKPDGSFEQTGRAVFGTGSMAAANGVTGMATTSYSRGGSTSTSSVSAVGAGAGGATRQRGNGAEFIGRYKLERWAMVVERDSGEIERVLFAASGDPLRAVFIRDQGYSK
ncbi:hypothetical protein [Mitsuaria sp. GD03876]|uniref:hypothetical protein n=1 Tax=Mitsuaria sp. GD03876 TaxID=2975399 RepID=UPI00244C958C|nr:hypothetical protein [Mitsuaria sp. GD03876]MDH0868005.1 hypothetical protein [Mitsuaria sp. GD03876]